MADETTQGARYATVVHIEKMTVAGEPYLRIVYKFVNDPHTPARETLVPAQQVNRSVCMGTYVRIHFCLSRVLKIERVG